MGFEKARTGFVSRLLGHGCGSPCRSAADNAENQARTCFLGPFCDIRFCMMFLVRGLPGLFCSGAGFYPPRIDHDRRIRFPDTLTCHFFQLLFSALDVCALAVGMIEFCRPARLISAVDLFALSQSGAATAMFTAVAVAAVAGAADEKYHAAFRTPAHSVTYLDV